jgi:hypothetical protein
MVVGARMGIGMFRADDDIYVNSALFFFSFFSSDITTEAPDGRYSIETA